ncbi:hypothetical protein ACFL0V_07320 [Nanoarchaeota archaeon]
MLRQFRLALDDYKQLLATAHTQGTNMEEAVNSDKYIYDYRLNKAKYLADNMKKSVAKLREIITALYSKSSNPTLGEQYSKIMVNVRLIEEKYYDPVRSLPIVDQIEGQLKPLDQDAFIQQEIDEIDSEKSEKQEAQDADVRPNIYPPLDAEPAKPEVETQAERPVEMPKELPDIKLPFLPDEIKPHVLADVHELERCYDNGCLRSSVILCGRILETALHRKYFEATGNDALEKNPGIGLGKLVAKLSEHNVTFDPGLMNQIHLINQVRISSVHVKKDLFAPNQNTTQAIILYTLDVLHKMFSK